MSRAHWPGSARAVGLLATVAVLAAGCGPAAATAPTTTGRAVAAAPGPLGADVLGEVRRAYLHARHLQRAVEAGAPATLLAVGWADSALVRARDGSVPVLASPPGRIALVDTTTALVTVGSSGARHAPGAWVFTLRWRSRRWMVTEVVTLPLPGDGRGEQPGPAQGSSRR